MNLIISFLLSIFTIFLVSCGGGGQNVPPIANAGTDQNQPLNAIVTLDGGSSYDPEGSDLTYTWSMKSRPQGSNAYIENSSNKISTFIPDSIGEYIVSLIVDDGVNESDESSATITVNKIIVYSNDFSDYNLSDLIIGDIGLGNVYFEPDYLRLSPGPYYYDRSFVSIDMSKYDIFYSTILSENISNVTYLVNISNENGQFNNQFTFGIFSTPDPSDNSGFGYKLRGGGFVGDRMTFEQQAGGLSPFGLLYNPIMDVSNGLSNLPMKGAFKISYEPNTHLWKIYFDQSEDDLKPGNVTNLIGQFYDDLFIYDQLPYIILGSETTGNAFFDNLTILVEY